MSKIFLNCLGLRCPDPLTLVRSKLRELETGDELEVLSDDIVSKRDIPAFCNFMGHKLEIDESDATKIKYLIVKNALK